MDIVFSLDEAARASYLQSIMQTYHCNYICVWSYLPQPSNCLLNLDGLYRGDEEQPSSSSGSYDRRLFNEYRQLILNVENNFVPGHAFKNNIPILELQESVLQTHASSQIQRQFYAAAGIKSSVFMASSNGEIELGFSQVNMAETMKLFAFPTWEEVSSMEVRPADRSPFQNPPSTTPSSSSLKSLSMESPESSSLFYNLPIASTTDIDLSTILLPPATASHGRPPRQQRRTPSILAAVHSSRPSSCSSSSSSSPESSKDSAFKKYSNALPSAEDRRRGRWRNQSMLKKSIVFYRNLNSKAVREKIQASRPAAAQLLHMISERKRREKLNESFQTLRSLLPPGTKRDKASVLATTREYLTKLKAEVSELSHRNRLLEAHVLQNRVPKNKDEATSSSSVNERFSIRASHAPVESTSPGEAEVVDLEITVRGEGSLMAEIAIRVLEFLKKVASVKVVLSFRGDEQMAPSSSLTHLTFRFSVQGGEWDESAFLEAVRRVVSDLAPE